MKRLIWSIVFVIVVAQSAFAATVGKDLILNGDFAAPTPSTGGIYQWVTQFAGTTGQPGLYFPVVAGTTPNSIIHTPCALVGYSTPVVISASCSSSLSQIMNVDRDALGNSITVWYQFCANDQTNGSFEQAEAWLGPFFLFGHRLRYQYDLNGNAVEVLPPFSLVPTPTPGWTMVQRWIPLESYSGQILSLNFTVSSSMAAGSVNAIYVDNCSLIYQTATKTITPTYTRTSTITKTSTITPTCTITPTITKTSTITPTVTKTLTLTPWTVPANDVVVFPNPATGNSMNFMYSPQVPSAIKIDVYNLAGMKVAHLEDNSKPAIDNQVTTWNITGVAPGIYLYKVTFEGTDGTLSSTKMKKFVISKQK